MFNITSLALIRLVRNIFLIELIFLLHDLSNGVTVLQAENILNKLSLFIYTTATFNCTVLRKYYCDDCA